MFLIELIAADTTTIAVVNYIGLVSIDAINTGNLKLWLCLRILESST